MTKPLVVLSVVALIGAAACGSYWLGFRHAWALGLMADAPVRGSFAIGQLKLLEQGRLPDLRFTYESDIDTGLMSWAQLEADPTYQLLNVLTGQDIVPGHEQYVKRVATYRKTHQSPLREPALVEQMLSSARKADPAFARELEEGGRESAMAIDRMITKYGQ